MEAPDYFLGSLDHLSSLCLSFFFIPSASAYMAHLLVPLVFLVLSFRYISVIEG